MASLRVMSLPPSTTLPAIDLYLDQAQRARLLQIAHPERALQFSAARYLAIDLLQQMGVQANLCTQPSGRPQAVNWLAADGLSWSHTQLWAAAALGIGRVGVDIETIRPRKNLLAIAKNYFSAAEVQMLLSLPSPEQIKQFYMLWVAKEALLKAQGTGIVGGLSRFQLIASEGLWRLVVDDASSWQVQIWQLDDNSLLAVASDTIQTWQLQADSQISQQLILQTQS
ncbi:4'-phosphopantetheinyl transferase superfamily protein [Chitinibacter fontanus]|uniref:4'-phosphopantetheinyl transferase superfamily protein n=1 Tax=Chitinibacter fontanus TaxID=1737446 RepID=A0A7D5ZHZ7_9NEIS|nr:4'-phosphopantetheinyl transferase superfamily protein [Chitinibacter fontanus]QLI82209.1 4'-phosphopantetheinyl transferase superfamily protein [Chitinibacter fontanus]